MRQDKKRILRITEELVNFLFSIGATAASMRLPKHTGRSSAIIMVPDPS